MTPDRRVTLRVPILRLAGTLACFGLLWPLPAARAQERAPEQEDGVRLVNSAAREEPRQTLSAPQPERVDRGPAGAPGQDVGAPPRRAEQSASGGAVLTDQTTAPAGAPAGAGLPPAARPVGGPDRATLPAAPDPSAAKALPAECPYPVPPPEAAAAPAPARAVEGVVKQAAAPALPAGAPAAAREPGSAVPSPVPAKAPAADPAELPDAESVAQKGLLETALAQVIGTLCGAAVATMTALFALTLLYRQQGRAPAEAVRIEFVNLPAAVAPVPAPAPAAPAAAVPPLARPVVAGPTRVNVPHGLVERALGGVFAGAAEAAVIPGPLQEAALRQLFQQNLDLRKQLAAGAAA
jgi:hypothetical protein